MDQSAHRCEEFCGQFKALTHGQPAIDFVAMPPCRFVRYDVHDSPISFTFTCSPVRPINCSRIHKSIAYSNRNASGTRCFMMANIAYCKLKKLTPITIDGEVTGYYRETDGNVTGLGSQWVGPPYGLSWQLIGTLPLLTPLHLPLSSARHPWLV